MKMATLSKVLMTAAIVSIAATGIALAGGGPNRQQGGKSNGAITRTQTVTTTSTATQSRDRLRDGSCLTTGTTATPIQTRDRLKDGSCLTK